MRYEICYTIHYATKSFLLAGMEIPKPSLVRIARFMQQELQKQYGMDAVAFTGIGIYAEDGDYIDCYPDEFNEIPEDSL